MNCRLLRIGWVAAVWVCTTAFPGFRNRPTEMDRCIVAATRELPDFVTATLQSIDGTDRQLLALRSYLRNRETLTLRWSWSDEEIASYQRSVEYRAVLSELKKITARFEALNPGYTLYVNSQVRSLDLQIRRWNENESVGTAGRELGKAVRRELRNDSCDALRGFLLNWWPARPPTLAAPGLSKHGQARAFDFQVKRGERIVAGTDTSRSVAVWDKKGWTGKVMTAVQSASEKFSGPLRIPYEPWHYEYDP